MSVNMSYCRFRNTLAALRECVEELDADGNPFAQLGDEERKAAKRLIRLCRDLADDYEHEAKEQP